MMFFVLKPNHGLIRTYLNLPKNWKLTYFEISPITESKTNLHIEKPKLKSGPIFKKVKNLPRTKTNLIIFFATIIGGSF